MFLCVLPMKNICCVWQTASWFLSKMLAFETIPQLNWWCLYKLTHTLDNEISYHNWQKINHQGHLFSGKMLRSHINRRALTVETSRNIQCNESNGDAVPKKKNSPTTNKINGKDLLKMYYLSNRQAQKKKTGNFSIGVNGYARHFLKCTTNAETNHNKNFIHISVPKYISFVITNFATFIL